MDTKVYKIIKKIIHHLIKENAIEALRWIKASAENGIELVELKLKEIELRKNIK